MNADPQGYYAALHLTPAATQADIQRAFRALIRMHHPDVGASRHGQDGGETDVRSILAAFAVLRNPRTRAEYDRKGRVPEVRASASEPTAGGATGAPGDAASSRAAGGVGGAPGAAGASGAPGSGPRDIPVRHHRRQSPPLRVTPVRWERGPW